MYRLPPASRCDATSWKLFFSAEETVLVNPPPPGCFLQPLTATRSPIATNVEMRARVIFFMSVCFTNPSSRDSNAFSAKGKANCVPAVVGVWELKRLRVYACKRDTLSSSLTLYLLNPSHYYRRVYGRNSIAGCSHQTRGRSRAGSIAPDPLSERHRSQRRRLDADCVGK